MREILAKIQEGEAVTHETSCRHKDGQAVAVALTDSPIRDAAGSIVGVLKIARDIKARKTEVAAETALRKRAEEQRLRLVIEAAPNAIIMAEADGRRIAETRAKIQVAEALPDLPVSLLWGSLAIQSLVGNALKFTRENTVPEIEICGFRGDGGQEVGIMVRDRGIGVPARHAERIFELFQRAVGHEIEGSGAGLAIVREIAERHGGHARVQMREGGGSEFTITFKRSRSIRSAAAAAG